jgi:beta-galactosidase
MMLVSAVAFAGGVGAKPVHTFAIGTNDFLLDGNKFQIRCGEIHAARAPREYWRNRLQMARAMGLNTFCACLFWNQIEPRPGKFDWSGQADVAEFCRIAQEEGFSRFLCGICADSIKTFVFGMKSGARGRI